MKAINEWMDGLPRSTMNLKLEKCRNGWRRLAVVHNFEDGMDR